jgi:methionyl-tRNA formyltransferase
MMQALTRLRRGEMIRQPQPREGVTLAPPLTPEVRLLHWALSAAAVAGVIRGLDPRPGAYTFWGKERLGVFGGRLKETRGSQALPGTVLGLTPQGLEIACGTGSVTAAALQLAGKKRLPAADFLRGHPRLAQERLGTQA